MLSDFDEIPSRFACRVKEVCKAHVMVDRGSRTLCKT